MKRLLQLFLLQMMLILSFLGYSQEKGESIVRNNIIHLEAGGIGGYGSLNYERVLPLTEYLSISGRIGISTLSITDFTTQFNPDLLVPITFNGFYGQTHKIHLGIGQLLSNSVRASHSTGKPKRETNFHTHIAIGYRYQKEQGRMIFGISYTPMLEYQEVFRHWGALTVGYVF